MLIRVRILFAFIFLPTVIYSQTPLPTKEIVQNGDTILVEIPFGSPTNEMRYVYLEERPRAHYNGNIKAYVLDRLSGSKTTSDTVRGRMSLHAGIDQYGKISGVYIAHSLNPTLDSAVLTIIKEMPPWRPAKLGDLDVPAIEVIDLEFP